MLVLHLASVVLQGFMSAVSLTGTLRFLNSTRRIETVSRLLLLNGFIFGGSIGFLEWMLLPALGEAGRAFSAYSDEEEILVAQEAVLNFFRVLWLAPMLVLSVLLNMVWYNDIAEDAFNKKSVRLVKGNAKSFRDELYRLLLFLVLALQSWVTLNLLPGYIGIPLEFFQSSWTISFYCYDYGWSLAGESLERRLHRFESHWPYMLGFGAPLAILALRLPLFLGYVVYALCFPICMILAIENEPIPHTRGWTKLRVFRPSQYLTLLLIRLLFGG